MSETAPAYPIPRSHPLDQPAQLGVLRDERPVTRVRLWNDLDAWLITRHEDVRQVLRDRRFSSDPSNPGFPAPGALIAGFAKQVPTFVRMDPPEHGAQRKMVAGEFLVSQVEKLRPRIAATIDDLLATALSGPTPFDLVRELAFPLPSRVITTLLGAGYEDHDFFQDRTSIAFSAHRSADEVAAALADIVGYLDRLVAAKRAEPGDDLLSRLAAAHVETGELSHESAVAIARTLLTAGYETTAAMIGLSALSVLTESGLADRLRADADLIPAAVEELLRFHSIQQTGLSRVAVEDAEVGGVTIRAGEGVIVSLASANHDDRQFECPARLDVDRDARQHVAFGYGVHQCLGQTLARVELQETIRALVNRSPRLRLAVPFAEVVFRDDLVIHGLQGLPVEPES
jgi:cytochrome P450